MRQTRITEGGAPKFIREWLSWGAGPRASQSLVLAAKARAVLNGRFAASVDDVAHVAAAVLAHRVVVSFQAQAQGVRAKDVIGEIVKAIGKDGR